MSFVPDKRCYVAPSSWIFRFVWVIAARLVDERQRKRVLLLVGDWCVLAVNQVSRLSQRTHSNALQGNRFILEVLVSTKCCCTLVCAAFYVIASSGKGAATRLSPSPVSGSRWSCR